MSTTKTFRQRTRTEDLPGFKEDFMLAVDVQEGNTLTLPGKGTQGGHPCRTGGQLQHEVGRSGHH